MHKYAERQADLYETPACAVEALLRVESVPYLVWEPACGPGAIVKVLRAQGHEVFPSDVVDYGWGHEVRDFFSSSHPYAQMPPTAIVTNPPYQEAARFVRWALQNSSYVAMLLRLAFLESEGRSDILDEHPPARIHVFKKRLPMMHRAGWKGKKASSAIAFAWFVWDGSVSWPKGPGGTIIDRI